MSVARRRDTFRLVRSRTTGGILVGVMLFLVLGFVLEPIPSALPNIAPQETVAESQLQLPVDETFQNDTSIDVEDVPAPDDPVSSDDSTGEQLQDEIDDAIIENILPEGSDAINLISEVTKIDSQGNATTIQEVFEVPALAFFVEEDTDVDFSQGFLVVKLRTIASDPTFMINGNAFMDILIDNQTALGMPVEVRFDGVSGEDGVIGLFGGTSQEFLFSIEDHLDKFPFESVTPIELKLNDVNLRLDNRLDFGATEFLLFTMDIANDANRILVQNEEGGFDKIFPTDDILNVKALRYANRLQPHIDLVVLTDSQGNELIRDVASCPIDQLDRNNIISCNDSNDGGAKIVDFALQRDQTYTLRVKGETSQNRGAFDFTSTWSTPKSQKDYTFICNWYQGSDPPFRGAQNDCHLLNCPLVQSTTTVRGVLVPFSTCDTLGAGN